jgi:predicted aspartyl protease
MGCATRWIREADGEARGRDRSGCSRLDAVIPRTMSEYRHPLRDAFHCVAADGTPRRGHDEVGGASTIRSNLGRAVAIALLCATALRWPGTAAAACEVKQRAAIALDVVGTVILVPVTVNDVPGTFILDTGAARTVVTPDAVRHFGLSLDEWTATTMRGVGGIERRRDANPRSITIGGIPLHRRSLARDATLRVATLPRDNAAGRRIDGLLGRDFLSAFDLSLDLAHGSLMLYDVHDCAGRFLPWTGDYASVPVENPTESALVVPVTLDGVRLRALLDSGASQTLIAAPGMARLQMGIDRLQNDPSRIVSGMGPHTVTMWQHRFGTLQIGTETIADVAFLVAPIQLNPICDLLLGSDWLTGRRVWISYATNQLFTAKQE